MSFIKLKNTKVLDIEDNIDLIQIKQNQLIFYLMIIILFKGLKYKIILEMQKVHLHAI
jgi:hypothetical protein